MAELTAAAPALVIAAVFALAMVALWFWPQGGGER